MLFDSSSRLASFSVNDRRIVMLFFTILASIGPFVPNLSSTSSRLLTSCGALRNSGMYVLQKDVFSPNTCFGIQADRVTLDLNGHTITYGAEKNSIPTYGILGVACWDASYGIGNPCGGSFNHLTVFGGTITQGSGAAPFSHGIRLGQGPGDTLTVHDIVFNMSAESSIPIYTTYEGRAVTIYKNVINNNVVVIQNRHQLQGQSIKLSDSRQVLGPAAIYSNQIVGGAQGGIFSAVKSTMIYDNQIRQKGRYTNDFSIYAWSDDGEVFSNTVDPISGRGIQIAGGSNGERVHDNAVVVIEEKDNQEYSGCQGGGAFGIQFDDNPTKATAYNNKVLAKADECGAQALRVTDSREGSKNVSHDNEYSAVRIGNSVALATGFGTGGATGFGSERDIFVGDTASVAFDWDGGQNLTFRDCTFGRGQHSSLDYVTFSFRNGGSVPVLNVHFIDSAFGNGAAKDNTDMKPILVNGDWPGPAEYFVDWSLKLYIQYQDGQPLDNAKVDIVDALGRLVSGVTNEAGIVSIVLPEFRMYNTKSAIIKELHTPYNVNVRKDGCASSLENSLYLTSTTSRKIQLRCEFHGAGETQRGQ